MVMSGDGSDILVGGRRPVVPGGGCGACPELAGRFGHQDWLADLRVPVHYAATYPGVITLTGMLASLDWRLSARSASAADRDLFQAEFRRRLPSACRDLANAGLQFLAIVRCAPVTWWHQPAAEVVS